MKHQRVQLATTSTRTPLRWNPSLYLSLLVFVCALPRPSSAQCLEEPTVWMDESTAESHLLARQDVVIPTRLLPGLSRVRKVVLFVTVSREGIICEIEPAAGPPELRKAAVETVREHWRYRRFLVDWKPVVVQFPVTVKFILSRGQRRVAAERHEASPAARRERPA